MKKIIIFDLDGTLIDTSEGIFNSVRYALKKKQINNFPTKRLSEFVGPPPVRAYQEIVGMSEDDAREATQFHRNYGKEKGIYEAIIYPEMLELLAYLKNEGYQLGVATLKRQDIAEDVLQNFNILNFFDEVVGIDFAETLTKKDTINMVLDRLNILPENAVMVGDTLGDYKGSIAAKVDFIAVTYGFGLNNFTDYSEFSVRPIGVAHDVSSIKNIISNITKKESP